MSPAIALTGWSLAALALGFAALSRAQLARRKELVARACHELRGPLAAARLGLHAVMRRGEAPPRRVAAVELELRRAGLALEDLYAARSGRRTRDRDEPIDVADLLAYQVDSWRAVARAYGCEVRLGSPPCDAIVRGDRLRLAQATANLVANAVEHGSGTIELSARARGDRVRIEVCDDGPGLPAPVAELARRPRAGRGRRGRGLAIATEIVRRHGGWVLAEPSARGARVAIELPAHTGSE
jgi:signal transduction histidine kinase